MEKERLGGLISRTSVSATLTSATKFGGIQATIIEFITMNAVIEVLQANITTLNVDAVVNAANSSLLGGGGVDGAIHRAAGPELVQACRTLRGCKTGHAKITQGYRLPARYVIHTVGPVWQGGVNNEAQMLAACYRNSLQLAWQHDIKSIAFPAISCGAYGYPLDQAAAIAIDVVSKALQQNDALDQVIFVCFEDAAYQTYLATAKAMGV